MVLSSSANKYVIATQQCVLAASGAVRSVTTQYSTSPQWLAFTPGKWLVLTMLNRPPQSLPMAELTLITGLEVIYFC